MSSALISVPKPFTIWLSSVYFSLLLTYYDSIQSIVSLDYEILVFTLISLLCKHELCSSIPTLDGSLFAKRHLLSWDLILKIFWQIKVWQLEQYHFISTPDRIFSRESESRIKNVYLSVCQSVTKTPQPLRIISKSHHTYQPPCSPTNKPLCISAIMPICHHAYLQSSQSYANCGYHLSEFQDFKTAYQAFQNCSQLLNFSACFLWGGGSWCQMKDLIHRNCCAKWFFQIPIVEEKIIFLQ